MIAYSIIMFVAAAPFLALGIAIYKGNTELIHDYHQKNVKESERTEYGRAIAKGMFVVCVTLLISGIIALFGNKEEPIAAVSLAVLFAGLIASFVVLVKVQKKYNGGLF